jgi:hypothetical protein
MFHFSHRTIEIGKYAKGINVALVGVVAPQLAAQKRGVARALLWASSLSGLGSASRLARSASPPAAHAALIEHDSDE